jgi:hypothetical protein
MADTKHLDLNQLSGSFANRQENLCYLLVSSLSQPTTPLTNCQRLNSTETPYAYAIAEKAAVMRKAAISISTESKAL